MGYCTKANMTARFGAGELEQLTDRDGSAGAIVDSVLDAAIARADSEINGYLARVYTLPLAEAPDVLVDWAADIARWALYTDHVPDHVTTRYREVIGRLKDVAAGRMALGDATPGDSQPTTSSQVTYVGPDRVFDRQSLRRF